MRCWWCIKTQELAGIDVVADGELYRWDINHAETNGMIDYFLRPMEGVAAELTLDQLGALAQQSRPAVSGGAARRGRRSDRRRQAESRARLCSCFAT